MTRPGPLSERAIILAPSGRDGEIAVLILKAAGFPAEVSADLPALCAELDQGAGLAIIADEAVHTADLRALVGHLERQPPWSDLPVVVLTRHGGGPERNPAAARLAEALGNVTFIERPFHSTTLASVVRTAVRGRRRQYEARALLHELRESEERLEQRVEERSEQLMREVSAREKAQEQLRQAQKMESLGQLTGGIAHDFNNLLMAVMGNLELLRKRVAGDPRADRLIDGALQGAKRGASLTQRLLAFARQQDLKAVPADMAALVRGMSDLLQRSLGPRVTLRMDIPEGLPPARVDANQIELAILNLAINARDAMPDGGAIDISLRQTTGGDRGDLAPGSYLRIRVADTGTGMDAATLGKAIEPFFSTKPTGKGTGLGLSMAHGLAVQLGGRLELASEVGKGTVADLWLPVATTGLENHEVVALQPASVRPAIILLVDDDLLIAMSTVDMLEDLGHTVIAAHSGEHALEIIRGGRAIDLMMTDHAMPGMTGVELAKTTHDLRPKMPILLVTGYADLPNGQILDLPRLGKPYQQTQLRTEIERLLAGAQSAA
jgi:signal transduction histidine kinase/CheY-like chemotaxis protein